MINSKRGMKKIAQHGYKLVKFEVLGVLFAVAALDTEFQSPFISIRFNVFIRNSWVFQPPLQPSFLDLLTDLPLGVASE